jgi:hypothetical protein
MLKSASPACFAQRSDQNVRPTETCGQDEVSQALPRPRVTGPPAPRMWAGPEWHTHVGGHALDRPRAGRRRPPRVPGGGSQRARSALCPDRDVPYRLTVGGAPVDDHLHRLASFSRLITTDLLGMGSSDAVPINDRPAMQAWTDGCSPCSMPLGAKAHAGARVPALVERDGPNGDDWMTG